MLYLTLIVYFMMRNYFITKDNHEWGKYLVILDNIFLDYNLVDKYIDYITLKIKRSINLKYNFKQDNLIFKKYYEWKIYIRS